MFLQDLFKRYQCKQALICAVYKQGLNGWSREEGNTKDTSSSYPDETAAFETLPLKSGSFKLRKTTAPRSNGARSNVKIHPNTAHLLKPLRSRQENHQGIWNLQFQWPGTTQSLRCPNRCLPDGDDRYPHLRQAVMATPHQKVGFNKALLRKTNDE